MDLVNDIEDLLGLLDEGSKKTKYPPQYKATGKRKKKLDRLTAMAKSDDPATRQSAYAGRENMEKAEREKPGYKTRRRPDSQKESIMEEGDDLTEGLALIREMVEEVLAEALSKKTKETLKKKAEKRGLTPGSVEAEYKKGLAAWATSGSRKGMSQHQWAMARVNSANPSKDWAVVKKSKRKKK